MIFACSALAIATAALITAMCTAHRTRQLQRQTYADLYLAAILNSGADYYRRRTAQMRARAGRRP
jgi:hypothetical protein